MPVGKIVQLQDLEDAKLACDRVHAEIKRQDPQNLSAYNVDILSAASIAIGVFPFIAPYRDRAAKLPEFNIRNFDALVDYAKAAWYLHITNLPGAEPQDAAAMKEEAETLRAKFLMWAQPLAASGKFSQDAVDSIKEGTGMKDTASDLVSLVTLYRSNWDEVRTMCGVTEQDLQRAAVVGPAVFALVSRRENEPATLSDVTLQVRQAWTLLDRAYMQCRRAITYFRFAEGDADTIAPSLRRNAGRHPHTDKTTTPESAVIPATPAVATASAKPPATGPVVGGGSSPFVG